MVLQRKGHRAAQAPETVLPTWRSSEVMVVLVEDEGRRVAGSAHINIAEARAPGPCSAGATCHFSFGDRLWFANRGSTKECS